MKLIMRAINIYTVLDRILTLDGHQSTRRVDDRYLSFGASGSVQNS